MGKALIFSDLHVHKHKKRVDRLHDCLKVLDWIIEEAVNNKCEDILFLGDLFHERSKIDIQSYLFVFEKFISFYQNHPDITVWLLVGNHDMYHKESWDVNSIKPLDAIPNINVIYKPLSTKIQGVNVDFLPHVENPIEDLDKLKEGKKDDELQLLLAHLAVHGATLNTLYATTAEVVVEHDDCMQKIDPKVFQDWDQTFLGHYHGPQVLTADGSVEYIGSPYELTFGEAYQDKHIMVFDMDSFKKEYIDNEFSPKHLIVPVEQIENTDVKNNFLQVIIDDISGQELIDVRKKLSEKDVGDLSFKAKEKKKEDAEIVEEAKAILYKSDEMLEEYLKQADIPEKLDRDELLQIGKSILLKGTES